MLLYHVFLLVLYAISISSIVVLLFTTYVYRVRWHPVVSVILWMTIPSAVVALLHYPFDSILSERLPIPPGDRPLEQQHTSLAYFCAVEAILLYLVSAAGSGLAVSFTLSLFAVMIKSIRPSLASSPRTWRSLRWLWDPSTTVLCVAPFIWALPLVFASIEALVRTPRDRYPAIYYSNTYCNIDDFKYQFVSGIILGVPLIVAAMLSLVIIGMLVIVHLRNRRRATQLLNVPLALRFAAIVIQIFITAIIILCELALKDEQLRGVFRFHIWWTALLPLITFCIFATQQGLIDIWRYWACRMVGREPAFTPRSSNEAQTLSGSSALGTTANDQHVIHMQDMFKQGSKSHRASSSAGGTSILDPQALLTGKRSLGASELNGQTDHDPESGLSDPASKHIRRGTTPAISELPDLPETPHAVTPAALSPQHGGFYSSTAAVSSQGLVSSPGHSMRNELLSPHSGLAPPAIVVTDGFGAMFGAQVRQGGVVGRPIMAREERERRLATTNSARRQGTMPRSPRERRPSAGLPPPPRSPRQSNARPLSAGGLSVLDIGPIVVPPRALSPSVPAGSSWNWDSPFQHAGNTSSTVLAARVSDGGSGSRHGSDLGIESPEKVRTPSSGSFERGHDKSSLGTDPRDSWASKKSRASVASDRTFG